MKNKTFLLLAAIAALLLVTAFWAGQASATVNCFTDTNGHWAESFICWLKDTGVSAGYADGTFRPENLVTRAELAVMLKRQAEVPPSSGLILITPGNGDWLKFYASDDISFNNFSTYTVVYKATAGDAFLSIQPSIPVVLYGKSTQLQGVEFCYSGDANTYLNFVEINTFTATTGAGFQTQRLVDYTLRKDAACRYYALPSPAVLTADDGVNFFIRLHWNAGGTYFKLGRTTFVFQPTGTTVAFPKAVPETVILQPEGENIPAITGP